MRQRRRGERQRRRRLLARARGLARKPTGLPKSGPERASLVHECRGQSTVEYVLVLSAFLAMLLALGAVWEAAGAGDLARLGESASSHSLSGEGMLGGMRDIVLF